MHHKTLSLLSAAVALSLGGRAFAQNDDCSGAIAVVAGANGAFTNAGSTTSFPWGCAYGDNDVWFVYTAPQSGNVTFDTCGGGFDTVMEVFNGNGGCGSLSSIDCNDDYCGLQSSVTVYANGGDVLFVRVGGFAGNTGSFPLNVTEQFGVLATATTFGAGCVGRTDSFYENFQAPTSFDLSGTAMTMFPAGNDYIVTPVGTFIPPSQNATTLSLFDDDEVTQALSSPFPIGAGSTSVLTICSNGFVSAGPGNGTNFYPDVSEFLNSSQTAWWCWHDLNPSISGSGQVKFEDNGSVATVTYDGVWDYGGSSSADANTFQMQFDLTTGAVTLAWQTMSQNGGTGFLVGFSPGGSSTDLGSTDLSVAVPTSFVVGSQNNFPITLAAAATPLAGSVIGLDTTGIGPTAPFGAVLLSLLGIPGGVDLSGIGMAGCSQYTGGDVTLLFIPAGASSVSTPFTVPGLPFVGVHVFAQSVVYDPTAGLTALGAMSSNGMDLGIGNL